MTAPNYESKWWGIIYDQMMEQDLSDLVERHRHFYHSNLKDASGPILECACGTGIFLLPLLASGLDMYGFDISNSMLSTLKAKAKTQGIEDIDERVSIQEFETFRYTQRFDAIIIPTNTFGMLVTQAAQIKTLQNIFAHLAQNGKLLLDINLAGMRSLVETAEGIEGRWHTWKHPETGRPIRQRIVGRYDFNNQQTLDHCFIEYDGQVEEFPMTGRWIFKEEFQLLLRLAGFVRWECFSTPDRNPLEVGLDETSSYWIVYKD